MNLSRDLPYAVLGAVVIVLGIQLPLSPFIGGAVAAGVRRGVRDEGVRTGAIAGGLATIALLLIGGLNATNLALPEVQSGVNSIYFGLLGLIVVLYVVILAALGGFVGSEIQRIVRRKIAVYR